ncbi:hypothetical protein [Rubellimicrobium sp. CFH 75288]|uniref:hypothetical protein n=1 Tax=Rubellimicrobium sp. CFH 75288 TaxID=2697034 RepID=UPI00141306BD|nr:hypothetical protein [Rubellimicrobium sp. CFH 75288]NAZ37183.1 hypothetical protein [Rubellimicrobium sp. CFH 75288]
MSFLMLTDREALIEEVRAYCAAAGIEASTLGVRALGNSRFFDRFLRRAEQEAEAAEKLRAYMAENPPEARRARAAGEAA